MSRAESYDPERVDLPDGHEAWITPAFAAEGFVDWYQSIPDGEDVDPNPPLPAEAIFAMLAAGIKAWSLTDEEGERTDITHANVSRLTWSVGKPLADWCNALIAEANADLVRRTTDALGDEQ